MRLSILSGRLPPTRPRRNCAWTRFQSGFSALEMTPKTATKRVDHRFSEACMDLLAMLLPTSAEMFISSKAWNLAKTRIHSRNCCRRRCPVNVEGDSVAERLGRLC